MTSKVCCLSVIVCITLGLAGCGDPPLIIGSVKPTANPQVAVYSISTNGSGTAYVKFGTDTNYAQSTWKQPLVPGGITTLYVAGMKAQTAYHMQAVVEFKDGKQVIDQDNVFTTGALVDAANNATITTTTAAGAMPQSGVEMLALAGGSARPTITDLNGNILWIDTVVPPGTVPNPFKLLSNGHFMINFSNGLIDGGASLLQELDLAGAVVWQMKAADLNSALSSATCTGCNITVVGTHHDFVALSNGHLVLLASVQRDISGTTVTGDVIIDLDKNHKPVWVWNEFDHLDVDRRPMGFPDWTHTNAILYSPDDGDLVISVRHQNWLIKVDYADGVGSGGIVWKLGYQGDFTLVGGTDPIDWFYAQHGPSFATSNTSGKFSMTMFDNGDDRVFPAGVTCGTLGMPPCFYSTVPLLQIDETAKTATLAFNASLPAYSFFGGDGMVLANGNLEFCQAANGTANAGFVREVTPANATVWEMQVNEYIYRGQRMPSLYPGVQW